MGARKKLNDTATSKPTTSASPPRLKHCKVKQREALAAETAAKSRAAEAEADVKAAQPPVCNSKPPPTAAKQRPPVIKLNEQSHRADTMDPASQTPERLGPPTARNTRIIDGLRAMPAPRYLHCVLPGQHRAPHRSSGGSA